MSRRTIADIACDPAVGDVIEIVDILGAGSEVLLRVIAVAEEHVGFKEYGKGRFWLHQRQWKSRINNAASAKVYNYPPRE